VLKKPETAAIKEEVKSSSFYYFWGAAEFKYDFA